MLQIGKGKTDEFGFDERVDVRSAEDLRRLARHEEELAEAADLPRVREKHRAAALSWTLMARGLERAERLARAGDLSVVN